MKFDSYDMPGVVHLQRGHRAVLSGDEVSAGHAVAAQPVPQRPDVAVQGRRDGGGQGRLDAGDRPLAGGIQFGVGVIEVPVVCLPRT